MVARETLKLYSTPGVDWDKMSEDELSSIIGEWECCSVLQRVLQRVAMCCRVWLCVVQRAAVSEDLTRHSITPDADNTHICKYMYTDLYIYI